jgi:HD-GYP domain-containing protein (c-di-GMP phosphodiesterase class II)
VADTLDAMTSDRPYRRALPFATAQAEIKRESGRQFDPEVVKVFDSLPEQTWQTIRTEVTNHRPRPHAHAPVHLGSSVPVPSVATDNQSLPPKKSKA